MALVRILFTHPVLHLCARPYVWELVIVGGLFAGYCNPTVELDDRVLNALCPCAIYSNSKSGGEIIWLIGKKPKGRSIMISNVRGYSASNFLHRHTGSFATTSDV